MLYHPFLCESFSTKHHFKLHTHIYIYIYVCVIHNIYIYIYIFIYIHIHVYQILGWWWLEFSAIFSYLWSLLDPKMVHSVWVRQEDGEATQPGRPELKSAAGFHPWRARHQGAMGFSWAVGQIPWGFSYDFLGHFGTEVKISDGHPWASLNPLHFSWFDHFFH